MTAFRSGDETAITIEEPADDAGICFDGVAFTAAVLDGLGAIE
jgi:hypothetical protein